MNVESAALQVLDGGTRSPGPAGREALAGVVRTLRALPDAQAPAVARLLEEPRWGRVSAAAAAV